MWYDILLKIPRSCLKPTSLNSENLSFKTTKISHYFGNENKSQKNTVLPSWMKLLVVRVEKSKLSDLQKFC